MGTATLASAPRVGGSPAPVSRGGVEFVTVYTTQTMSNSYATGGETLVVPSGYGTLYAVEIINRHDGTRIWEWTNGTTTPKAKAYDAFATEEGNATDVSAVTLYIKFIFTK